MPISLTVRENLLYVLNAGGNNGGTDSIAGFRITNRGLLPLAGSSRPLSAPATGPAQIGFTPDGTTLIATERATNKISTYQVNHQGYATGPHVQASSGMTPFGFCFTKDGKLIVVEANGGAANPGGSTVSLYSVAGNGTLTVDTASLPTQQTSACWIAIDPSSRFAYTSNTPAATLTGLKVGQAAGTLRLLNPDGGETASTGPGSAPTDSAIVGGVLYVLDSGLGQIMAFTVNKDGSLAPLATGSGFPATGSGLVVR